MLLLFRISQRSSADFSFWCVIQKQKRQSDSQRIRAAWSCCTKLLCCGPACCCVWVLASMKNHHHVSLSFLTVTSPPPAPPPPADPLAAPGAGAPAAPDPGPVPAPDGAADAAPAPPVPSMVETSPCMKAQGGLLAELSNGQRSPLGQYTSPSPRRLWMYTLVQGKQNLKTEETCYYAVLNVKK